MIGQSHQAHPPRTHTLIPRLVCNDDLIGICNCIHLNRDRVHVFGRRVRSCAWGIDDSLICPDPFTIAAFAFNTKGELDSPETFYFYFLLP